MMGRLPLYLFLSVALATIVDAAQDTSAGQPQRLNEKRGRGKKQIVWDFGNLGTTNNRQTVTKAGPSFAIEPPSFVEYLNSTGAVIACRPTLTNEHNAEPSNGGSYLPAQPAATVNQKRAPISISWRQVVPSAGSSLEQHWLVEGEDTDWRDLDDRAGQIVRQDGALVLRPTEPGEAANHIYRCCLSNQFGSLCSRPVRTRQVPELNSPPPNLEVFDELATAGSSIQLKCLSSPTIQKYLDFTHWLKDDKMIASSQHHHQPPPINQKYLMLATGELIIRNVSRLADGTRPSSALGRFKCKARHRISGQTLTTKVGAKIIIDDSSTQPPSPGSQNDLSPSSSLVWARENTDQIICAPFSPQIHRWLTSNNNAGKFVWYFEEEPLNSAAFNLDDQQLAISPQVWPLFDNNSMCLLIRQVQLKHAGRYVCETSNGLYRASVQLSVASAKLTAQLQLLPAINEPNAKEMIITKPLASVQFGATVQLNCSISGQPYDTIAWFKDSRFVAISYLKHGSSSNSSQSQSPSGSVADQSNLKLVSPTVIRIERFLLKNSGIYQCQVYTSKPNHSLNHPTSWLAELDQLRSASASIQLDVAASRPSLVQKFPQNLSLARGSQVSLQCSAFGLPIPQFIWFLDGFPIISRDSSLPEVASELYSIGDYKDTDLKDSEQASMNDDHYLAAQFRHFIRLSYLEGSLTRRQTAGDDHYALNNAIEDERFKISTQIVSVPPTSSIDSGKGNSREPVGHEAAKGMAMKMVVSQLNISQMEPTEMGAYKCLAFNSLGFIQHSAYLSLASSDNSNEPRIERRSYQPNKVSVMAGQVASLQCPLIGHPLARVDWFRDDEGTTNQVGSSSSNNDNKQLRVLPSSHRQRIEPINRWGFGGQLELINVDKSAGDSGLYSCRLARQTRTASPVANLSYDDDLVGQVRLDIKLAPLIDKQTLPEMVHTNEGMRTKLVCSVVQGDHPIEIRWLRRTNSFEDVSSDSSSIFHRGSSLAAVKAAGFEEVPQETKDEANGHQQQQQQQQQQETDLAISVHNLEDSSLLTFRQISYLDSGDYLCLASNQVSQSARLTRIVVNVAPTWSVEPPNELSVLLGSRLQIDCQAHGFPEPTVVWRKRQRGGRLPASSNRLIEMNSQRVGSSSSNNQDSSMAAAVGEEFAEIGPNYRRRQPTNGSLIIEQSDQSDAGTYMCQIANGIGVGLSKVIQVRVNVAPHFKQLRQGSGSSSSGSLSPPISIAQAAGSRAELKCLASGDQPMIIGWRRDNIDDDVIDLVNDNRHRLISEHNKQFLAPGQTTSSALESVLQIDNVARNDSGQYVCVASNEFGSEEMRIQLIVQEPPEAPLIMRPIRAGSRQATLSFRLPYSGNSPIKQYAIHYRPIVAASNNETGDWQQAVVEVQSTSDKELLEANNSFRPSMLAQSDQQLVNLVLCCLQPFTRYLVRVRAINELGQSEPSKPVPFMTDEEAIGAPPLDVAVEPTGAHSLKVRWRAPAVNMQNGLIRGYYIGYRAIGAPLTGQVQAASMQASENLEQYQYKNVQLDLGPATLASALTPSGPALPFSMVADSLSDFITEPLNGTTQMLASRLQLAEPMGQVYASYLTNLKRKTAYSIIVQAYNKVGAGPRSDQIIVSTLDAAPPMSPSLKLLSVGYKSAQFAWSSRRFKHDNTTNHRSFQNGNRAVDQITNHYTNRDSSARPDGKTDPLSDIDHDENDDDPQSYYTINFRPDPTTGGSSNLDQEDWQQRRLSPKRQSFSVPYELSNLKCGSRYSAFMTATNSLGQSEPGEMVKFATLGAAPIAPNQAQEFLQVNSSHVVLRLGQWQNVGCLITLFILKYRPLNQLKWTVLEHQVHPTIQTLTVSGTAQFMTRSQTSGEPSSARLSAEPTPLPGRRQPSPGRMSGGRSHTAQVLSDFIIRNLASDTNYKLIVEANSEAGSTQAEYEFETANFTSSMVAITVNGLNAADLMSANMPDSNDSPGPQDPNTRPYSLVEPKNEGGELLDFNYGQRGLTSTTFVGPLQRYAFGVWSLTTIFVIGSVLMAVATIVLAFRNFMRTKPNDGSPDNGLVSALLCCSAGSSSSRSSSSDQADSSHSTSSGAFHHHPLALGPCYQMPDIRLHDNQNGDATTGYCSLATNSSNMQPPTHDSNMGHYLSTNNEESLPGEPSMHPLRQLVSSSSLSTIGRFNAASNIARNTHTLGRFNNQDRHLARSACYAATLGKQQSTFLGQNQAKLNREQSPIYGRLVQQHQDNHAAAYLSHSMGVPQFNYNSQPMSSSTGTSGYETSSTKLGRPSEVSNDQQTYLHHNSNHNYSTGALVSNNYGDIAESNLYEGHLHQAEVQQHEQKYPSAFSISGHKIDCSDEAQQLLSSAYGMIFGTQQQQSKQECQQQQLEPQELTSRLHSLANCRQSLPQNANNL